MSAMQSQAPDTTHHTWLDDAVALLTGALFIALGITMFEHAGLLTGGVAGIALLSYATGASLAWCFFLINLPFFAMAWLRLGPEFTVKSFAAVALVSVFTAFAPTVVRFELLEPLGGSGAGRIFGGGGICWRCCATAPAWAAWSS